MLSSLAQNLLCAYFPEAGVGGGLIAIARQVGARAEEASPYSAGRRPRLPRRRRRWARRVRGGPSAGQPGRRCDRRCCGRSSTTPTRYWPPAAGRGGHRRWTALKQATAWAWPAGAGRSWRATLPWRWSTSAGWDEAERVSREGLEGAPPDAAFVDLPLAQVTLELGLGSSTPPRRGCGLSGALFPAPIAEAQMAGPLFAGLAELALWRGDQEQAKQLVAEGRAAGPGGPAMPRRCMPSACRVEADRAELARARRSGRRPADDGTATTLLGRLSKVAAGPVAVGIPEVAAWHACRSRGQTRQQGPLTRPAGQRPGHRLGTAGPAPPGRLRRLPPGRGAAGRRRPRHRRDGAGSCRRNHRAPGRRPLGAEVQALARRARLDLAPHAAVAAPRRPARRRPPSSNLAPARSRGACAGGGRAQQSPDRPGAVHQPQDRQRARLNILAKLGVAGQVEAAAIAHRLGLD